MGLKAAVQALKKAEKLKEKVQNSKDLLNDNEAWLCQQQLQRIYQQVLILDLEYALDRKVEQELWNHGFKNYIGTLQNLAKDKTNPKRSETQAMLLWCLEAASGFYLTLLQEICTAFDLDLPFRRKGTLYGNKKLWHAVEHLSQPHKSSCYYICQHCLVHLGDIARYRNQSHQAESFYRHAVVLAPHSGQPYNQLALLEANRGDKLSTVFHYVRSVAVRHPFPAAATNLVRTITKCVEETSDVEGRGKLSVSEFVALFLKVHGLLHTGMQIEKAEKYIQILTTTLTAHVATESLTSSKLIQMLAINLFALHNSGGLDNSTVLLVDEELTNEEQQAKCVVLNLVAGSLCAFLLPVYTMKEGDSLLEYFALPAIKLTLDWIQLEPQVLLDAAFSSRLQIWPSLCKLLNGLQHSLTDFIADKYSYMPLPEDEDLLGFRPLEKSLNNLRFSNRDCKLDASLIHKLRASRLTQFGKWLASLEDFNIITCRVNDNTSVFEAVSGQQILSSDLLRELEELTKPSSPVPSETSSWGSSTTTASTPDLLMAPSTSSLSSPTCILTPPFQDDPIFERRSGILKPQGSSEKTREKETIDAVKNEVPQTGTKHPFRSSMVEAISLKSVQNSEQLEGKQVTFKTPSPCDSPQTEEVPMIEVYVPKPAMLSAWQSPPKQPPVLRQQNQLSPQQQQSFHTYQPPSLQNGSETLQQKPSSFNNRTTLPGGFGSFGTQPSPPVFHLPPPNMYAAQHMKVRQPQFEPWNEDCVPWPPSSWWGRDQNSSAETNRSQQVHNPGYFNNLSQRNTDVVSNDLFPNTTAWDPLHLNLNLPQQQSSHFYQTPQHVRQDISVFNQEDDVNQLATPDSSSKSGSTPGPSSETSTIFSSNSDPSSFSSLGSPDSGNMYTLFNNSAWSSANQSSSPGTDGSGTKTALGGVVGMTGSNSLALGYQSFWSGPGPSPLERLLEQQKQLREGPAPKGGT